MIVPPTKVVAFGMCILVGAIKSTGQRRSVRVVSPIGQERTKEAQVVRSTVDEL